MGWYSLCFAFFDSSFEEVEVQGLRHFVNCFVHFEEAKEHFVNFVKVHFEREEEECFANFEKRFANFEWAKKHFANFERAKERFAHFFEKCFEKCFEKWRGVRNVVYSYIVVVECRMMVEIVVVFVVFVVFVVVEQRRKDFG